MSQLSVLEMEFLGIEPSAAAVGVANGFEPIRLNTSRGSVPCRYLPVAGATRAVVWVTGAAGGWDSPADGLYDRLSHELAAAGIASLRVCYRNPGDLGEATLDILAGLLFLERRGIGHAAVVGHGFGGAAAIAAAAAEPVVKTVVALSTQSCGAEDAAARLAPRCSLLLLHGRSDWTVRHESARHVYSLARQPKELVVFDGAGHSLDEAAPEVYDVTREWLLTRLTSAA